MASNARDIAVWALRDRGGNVSAHLDRVLEREDLSSEDRALARELALGVVRRRATLQSVLRAFLRQPDKKLSSPLEEVLHVALYQVLFLDRIPHFAAVNEAVAQAERFHHRRQMAFVNGLLRSVTRDIFPMQSGPPPLADNVVPVGPSTYRRFSRAVLPNPVRQAAEHLAAAYSLPVELASRWMERYGPEQAAALAGQADARAPLVLRVNRLKGDVPAAISALAAEGVVAKPHANGVSVVLEEGVNVIGLSAFASGLIQPQDATATAVGIAAAPRAGMRVLDFCAAPGTKTTHLAELMDNQGCIVAADVSTEKIERIESNCRRLGVSIVQTRLADRLTDLTPGSFNLALVDAPCSNTGVLARRAEARWRFSQEDLRRLTRDQELLAAAAASYVAPGGRLIYSTCSIEPEECQEVARRLCRRDARLSMVAEELTLPGGAEDPTQWHDGGYFAIFRVK